MSDTTPTTRAERAALLDEYQTLEPVEFGEVEFIDRPEFLPLAVRRVLYVLALAGNVAAPVLAISAPEYAAAIVTGSAVLGAAALGTALANPSR